MSRPRECPSWSAGDSQLFHCLAPAWAMRIQKARWAGSGSKLPFKPAWSKCLPPTALETTKEMGLQVWRYSMG